MEDPFAWLEDVEGPEALDWVRRHNAVTEALLFADPGFEPLRSAVLEVLEADDRIPMPTRHGSFAYNFWQDASHRRGVLRRTPWELYRTKAPEWETILDVDALAEAEGESWVFHSSRTRRPDRERALVELSPGGSDASVTRELDLVAKQFVGEEAGGFVRPLSKGWLAWACDDAVYAGHDFGPGSLTSSGYPRTVRRWERGTPLVDAPVVFEGETSDVAVSVDVGTLPGHRHQLFTRALDFFTSRHWLLRDGEMVELDIPPDANVEVRETWLLIRPRKPCTLGARSYPAGSLLVADLERFLAGDRSVEALFSPGPRTSLTSWAWTRHHVLLCVSEDVRDRVEALAPAEGWARRPLEPGSATWKLAAAPIDPDVSDEYLVTSQDYLTPLTLSLGAVGSQGEVLRRATARFEGEGMGITQHFATSADGTRVPYFLVGPDGPPGPTLLSAYGGFEVSLAPVYSGVLGRAWLARGGRYAEANIRGGGEYGPAWHEAALRERRPRAYEDFEAVARDLVARGVTTPAQLGIMGGSNGGLLVGNMYVRRPELFGAVVCRVPLLDMKRYSHLLAGASWVAEYGDPDDPSDWAFIRTFSPYHLAERGRPYPPLLLTTSTRDDRVHPAHARKMAALLEELGHHVAYWENTEGGHPGAADAPQQATMSALCYTFLARHLGERGR